MHRTRNAVILEGRQPANLGLDDLLQQFPIDWDRQLATLTEGR
jgi:hypothetical protein